MEKRYLLSVKSLLEDEQLLCRACEKLDTERKKRAQRIKSKEAKAQSVGAGLLLQYVLQKISGRDYLAQDKCVSGKHTSVEFACGEPESVLQPCLEEFNVEDILEELQSPVEIDYTYGRLGKPYFKNLPWYFSMSHSGEYVFCAVSEREVGADIQKCKPLKNHHLEKRYFTVREQQLLEGKTEGERQKIFYRLWTKKEAYGKLTGDGIGDAIGLDMQELSENVLWEEWQLQKDYSITVCRYRKE